MSATAAVEAKLQEILEKTEREKVALRDDVVKKLSEAKREF